MDIPVVDSLDNLTDEQLDAIAGGYIVDVGVNNPKFDRRYAVVNDKTGGTILFTNDLGYAEGQADTLTEKVSYLDWLYSKRIITPDDYESIFGRSFF